MIIVGIFMLLFYGIGRAVKSGRRCHTTQDECRVLMRIASFYDIMAWCL